MVRCKLLSSLSLCQVVSDYLIHQDPIYLGHYPDYMRQMLQARLPVFTLEELAVVKGSSDFYGMNTYTTNLCSMFSSSTITH